MFINYFTFQTGVQISGGWEANLEVFILPITKEVFHYVSRNIIAMLGTSIYVLIDTLFISIAAGALGLTALPSLISLTPLVYYSVLVVQQFFR